MMKEESFDEFQQRLNILDKQVRDSALELYAREIYRERKMSKVEALEKGIQKAEMESRQL